MEKSLSLKSFINHVKAELVDAVNNPVGKPFFSLQEIELELSVYVEANGKLGFKFYVETEVGAVTNQTHKIKLNLKPIPHNFNPSVETNAAIVGEDGKPIDDQATGKQSDSLKANSRSGGGGGFEEGVVLDKVRDHF